MVAVFCYGLNFRCRFLVCVSWTLVVIKFRIARHKTYYCNYATATASVICYLSTTHLRPEYIKSFGMFNPQPANKTK